MTEPAGEVILIPKHLRMDWVDWMARDASLSHVAFRVACIIGRHFNKKTGEAFPRQDTIARALEVSVRTVWGAIKELEIAGYLMVRRRELTPYHRATKSGQVKVQSAGGRGVANTYAPGVDRSQITATFTGRKLATRCDLWWEERSQNRVTKVATSCDPTLIPPSGVNPLRVCERAREALGRPGERLRSRLGDAVFASWFGKVTLGGLGGETVRLSAPTRYIANTIRSQYLDAIVEAWRADHPEIRHCEILGPESATGR